MNINLNNSNSVNTYFNNNTNNNAITNNANGKKNTLVSKLQKQMTAIDKNIAGVRENEKLSAYDKKEKIKQLEEQKQELLERINEEKIKEKMNETEKKIEEAEEIEEKRREKEKRPATPLEEIKAELGIEVSSKNMIKASRSLDVANNKLKIASDLRQEAKVLQVEYETDIGRGQSVGLSDYRVKRVAKLRSRADKVQNEAMETLGKTNKIIKETRESLEKVKDKNEEINNKVEEDKKLEENKNEKMISTSDNKGSIDQRKQNPIGKNVDVKL
ncbi:hypothetical protein SH1V18_24020 [Vallitalea longa]|uniref:Uncharacterized protein n=1 Tax=Vallitalea longa TaxID=2936439 RepID=A0A9W5YAJ1_9FIRM|nr:hypothetical protein [Vallitalea longa]GKX29922.1 hypothetical protein SH1V18_24020 [Vallitalea longa]